MGIMYPIGIRIKNTIAIKLYFFVRIDILSIS